MNAKSMGSPRDEIARRVAEKLAPEVGPKLGMYVEKLIDLGDEAGDEPPAQRIGDALLVGLAGLVMTAIKLALDELHRYQDEQRRVQEAQRKQEEEQQRKDAQDRVLSLAESTVAMSREALALAIRAGMRFPEEVPTRMRVALVESVAEESLEQEKRLESKR